MDYTAQPVWGEGADIFLLHPDPTPLQQHNVLISQSSLE